MRVKVYGCSPGWLLRSVALSILLTIVLNLLIRAFWKPTQNRHARVTHA